MSIPIAYVVQQLVEGGAERQLLELIKGINRERFHPILICFKGGGWNRGEYEKHGISITTLNQRWAFDPILILRLSKLFKENRITIVHSWLFNANFHGRIAAKISRVPLVIASDRGLDLRRSLLPRSVALMIDSVLLRLTDLIITNSKAGVALLLQRGIDPSKVKCIYNGIDLARFSGSIDRYSLRRALGIGPSTKVVGFIGRLEPVKNPKMLLSAAVKVLVELPDTKFLIVGDGSLREHLEALARDLGIGSNVLFLGNRRDVPRLLSVLDICVLPSLWENCSSTILESMAMGRPVIAFSVGGNPEVITNGVTGFLVNHRSVDQIASTIICALKDKHRIGTMGELAKTEIRQRFALERMIRETEETYLDLLECRSAFT